MAKKCVGMYSPTNAVACKTPGKGIKENTLQCYIDYSKIILMEKGVGLNTSIHKLYTEIRNIIPKHTDLKM